MPTNRHAVRHPRRGRLTPEAVALFLEIERTPGGDQPYTDASHRLAELLGLTNEWWVPCHVNNRTSRPCHPPGYVAYDAFWKVLEVRKALLAVCAQRDEVATPQAPQSPTIA